jgi:O-antigen/teichoic acid export membrane protein
MLKVSDLISSNSFKSFLIQFTGFALSFLISIVLTNLYSAKVYGEYILVFSTLDLLAVFSLMGYNQLFSIVIPKIDTEEEQFEIYKIASKKSLKNGLILSLILIITCVAIKPIEKNIYYFLISGAIILPLMTMNFVNTNFLYSLKETFYTHINDKIVRNLIFLALVFIFTLLNNTIFSIIFAFIVANLVSLLFSYLLRKKRISFKHINSDYKKNRFNSTIYLLLVINIINLIFSKTDTFQISFLLGTDYAGVNNVYVRISQVMHLIMSSSLLIISPVISKYIAQERFNLVRIELKKVFHFAIPLSFVLLFAIIFISPFFLNLYKSEIYQQNSFSITLYCFSAILGILTGPASLILMLSNKLKHLIIGFSLELILNLLLNAYLIPKYSIFGAATSTIISELAVNLYFSYICFKEFKLNTLVFGK